MGTPKEQIINTNPKQATEQELASIMADACARYVVNRHDHPKSANNSWTKVEHIAEEIVRRKQHNQP